MNSLDIDWQLVCKDQFEKKRRGRDINFKEREKDFKIFGL